MSIEAMKQALEALELAHPRFGIATEKHKQAITALRAAIEQGEKPVAWQVMVEDEAMKEFPIKDMAHDWCVNQKLSGSPHLYWMRPLYTTPPAAPRQWVGLTDEEIEQIADSEYEEAFVRLVEAKLKEKNT